ncbi:MAG: hypothetical protein JWM31_1355 [Solirubrobacterales bacterium]|nr:hypothetical protein [Solirubrobacterales bacterium]
MTRASAIIAALEAAGERGCTTAELCQPDVGGVRFGGRIDELRKAGYIIRESRIRQGSHRYVLAGVEAPAPQPAEPAPTPIRSIRGRRIDQTVVVAACYGCLTNHPRGFKCPHGHTIELMELGAGPRDQPCRRAQILARRNPIHERKAA